MVIVSGAKVAATATGAVTIRGSGSQSGTDFNDGVMIGGGGTQVSADSGALDISGSGGAVGLSSSPERVT